jgi:hypothetical protein
MNKKQSVKMVHISQNRAKSQRRFSMSPFLSLSLCLPFAVFQISWSIAFTPLDSKHPTGFMPVRYCYTRVPDDQGIRKLGTRIAGYQITKRQIVVWYPDILMAWYVGIGFCNSKFLCRISSARD